MTPEEVHNVISEMCSNPGRSFNIDKHAKKLNDILSATKIQKDVADLFIQATTISTPFTGPHTKDSLQAVKNLCEIKGNIVDNLLRLISFMSDAEHKIRNLDMSTGRLIEKTKVFNVSFAAQREMAKAELNRRGSPKYDPRYYV